MSERDSISSAFASPPVEKTLMSRHPLYVTYNGMLNRCYNKSEPGYKNYGARGIAVCKRWLDSFDDFASDMGDRPGRGYSLGRIDNDGDYSPGNCRWETAKQQAQNTRRNVRVTIEGRTQVASEWAREIGISREGFRLRLRTKSQKNITRPAAKVFRAKRKGAKSWHKWASPSLKKKLKAAGLLD